MTTMTDDKTTELRALAGYLRGNAEWYGEDEESPGPDCERWWKLVESLIPTVESREELPTAVVVSNQAEDTWSLACPLCDGAIQLVETGHQVWYHVQEYDPETKVVMLDVNSRTTTDESSGTDEDWYECRICLQRVEPPAGVEEEWVG